ncbi:GNAT family N-acetyltransferase [Streptomyces sp. KM273126]|uniref:GNAT family N-acetyltransferase n=1 Tax=Streptomyces sp. KM273126 TaxID=2545247 RepID=UPI00103C674D|nr:GNAT family N-acetyltransferase [Streptomyces sp. KM273126]MBA2813597.1 GNAT family N-acetyltransferase [Streptomyces sp. KM273126]
MTSSPAIRPYRSDDREALDDICIRTAHSGRDSRPVYADPGIFPVVFAAPYVQLEPELAFVVDDGQGRAVGYILGTADTARFAEDFRTKWLPLVADRYPEPVGAPSTPDEAIIQLLHRPERMVVPEVAAYPAHLHIDLLPEWQGRGHGRALMRTFLGALQDRGVPTVHLAMATANAPARAFYGRLGFHEIEVPDSGQTTFLGRSTKELDRL